MRPVNNYAANQIIEKEKRKAVLLKLCTDHDIGYPELAEALNLNLSVISHYCFELWRDGWIIRHKISRNTKVRTIKFDPYPIPEFVFVEKPRNRVHNPVPLPFDRKLSAMMGYTDIEPQKGNRPKESLLEQIYHATEFMRKITNPKACICGNSLSMIDQ